MRQAAKDAGYAKSTAEVKSYGILQRPRVQLFLTDALERAGITPDALAKPIQEALQACVRLVNSRQGTFVETELPDHQARLQAYDRVVAAYGAVPRAVEMLEPPLPSLSVTINEVDPKDQAKPIKEVVPPSGSLPSLTLNVRDPPRRA